MKKRKAATGFSKAPKRRIIVGSILLLFAFFGTVIIYRSFAATTAVSLEAENGTRTSNVSLVDDTNASGSKATQFPSLTSPGKTIKVMPLGDSITLGYTVNESSGSINYLGGYRTFLWQTLVQQEGNKIDLVGSVSSGSGDTIGQPYYLGDKDGEGHSGWCIDATTGTCTSGVLTKIDSWITTYTPEVILLHIGTNDIWKGGTGTEALADLDSLIGKIFASKPNTKIVLAKIIPLNGGTQQKAERITYNNGMSTLAAKYQSRGNAVEIVDMSALLTLGTTVTNPDYSDGLHPTMTGYRKIADAWYPKVKAFYDNLQ